ncbi:unnamed protein product [Auanema sp. JU1783]|nr:unnamed protein product [Auanema sp. JU1783]
MGDHFMYMWFHTDPKNTILFGFWNTHNGGEIGYSCVIIFFLSIFLELVKYARWRFDVYTAKKTDFYEKKYFHQLIEMYHISQTLLYGIQTLTMYFVMLVFMTFSIWLCISIVCGLSIGHYMFGIRRSPVDTVDPLQLNDDTYILNTTGYQRSRKVLARF